MTTTPEEKRTQDMWVGERGETWTGLAGVDIVPEEPFAVEVRL